MIISFQVQINANEYHSREIQRIIPDVRITRNNGPEMNPFKVCGDCGKLE